MELPYKLENRALLRPGEVKGLNYDEGDIQLAIALLNKPSKEKCNSLYLDHADGVQTWVGEVQNVHWDKERKLAIGDLLILDADLATKISFQVENGETAFGISPKLTVREDKGNAKDIAFKNFSLVLQPAGGKPLMLEEEFEIEIRKKVEKKEVTKSMATKKDEKIRVVEHAGLVGLLTKVQTAIKDKKYDDALGILAVLLKPGTLEPTAFPKAATSEAPFLKGVTLSEGTWQEILRTGAFAMPDGTTLIITEDDLDTLVASFEGNVRGQRIPVDLDHDPKSGAMGWFDSLKRGGEKLLAKFDWTKPGAALIGNKVYQYFSSQIGPWLDPESGEEHPLVLYGGALTNFPFIKGMATVSLNEFQSWVVAQDNTQKLQEEKAKATKAEGKAKLEKDNAMAELSELQGTIKSYETRLKVLEAEKALRELNDEVENAMRLDENRVIAPRTRTTVFNALQNPTKGSIAALIQELTAKDAIIELEEKGTSLGEDSTTNLEDKLDKRARKLMEEKEFDYATALKEASAELMR